MQTFSTNAATPGTGSSTSPGPSCPSAFANGPTGSDQRDLVLEAKVVLVVRSLIAGWKSTPGVSLTAGVMVLSAVGFRRMMVFSGVMPRCEVRDSRNGSVRAPQGRIRGHRHHRPGRDDYDPPRRK